MNAEISETIRAIMLVEVDSSTSASLFQQDATPTIAIWRPYYWLFC